MPANQLRVARYSFKTERYIMSLTSPPLAINILGCNITLMNSSNRSCFALQSYAQTLYRLLPIMEDFIKQFAIMRIPAGLMTRPMAQQNDDSHFRVAGFSMGSMAPKADAYYEVSYSSI
jgi:hypothetical protein